MSMDLILFSLFFTVQILCKSFTNESTAVKPFWINPCGYYTASNDIYSEEDDQDIISKLLLLASVCQYNIDSFKNDYIISTFNSDYFKHYQLWLQKNNSWMTSRLLKNAEDILPKDWLVRHSFPSELIFTYEMLQQVSVGYEILFQDASQINTAENKFLDNFTICKNNLQELLCEFSYAIDNAFDKRPIDITRDAVPIEVRQETSSVERNLTNSIIFRDYMIVIKYIISTYSYLLSLYENNQVI